jgi:hypothetical protein
MLLTSPVSSNGWPLAAKDSLIRRRTAVCARAASHVSRVRARATVCVCVGATYAVSAKDADQLRGTAARGDGAGRRRLHLQLLRLWGGCAKAGVSAPLCPCATRALGGPWPDLGHGRLEDKVGQERGRAVLEGAIDVDNGGIGLVAHRVKVDGEAVLVVADHARRLRRRRQAAPAQQIAERVKR